MTSAECLEGLAVRCEQAIAGDRELDVAIAAALAGATMEWQAYRSDWAFHRDGHWVSIGPIPPYSASLDAAVTLVPEEWLVLTLSQIAGDGMAFAELVDPFRNLSAIGVAKEMHTALCAAALRARSHTETPHGPDPVFTRECPDV